MTYIQNHAGWITVLICYAAAMIWLTWEFHQAPTQADDDDITIDDLIN